MFRGQRLADCAWQSGTIPMNDDALIQVSEGVAVPRSELTYRATRSGGPGGQHVNTSSTRIELTWNVDASTALSDEQRARIREKLSTRIDTSGNLRVVASVHRSQAQNRDEATRRFATMLERALRLPRARRKTRPPRAAKEARLEEKKKRSERKKGRGPVEW